MVCEVHLNKAIRKNKYRTTTHKCSHQSGSCLFPHQCHRYIPKPQSWNRKGRGKVKTLPKSNSTISNYFQTDNPFNHSVESVCWQPPLFPNHTIYLLNIFNKGICTVHKKIHTPEKILSETTLLLSKTQLIRLYPLLLLKRDQGQEETNRRCEKRMLINIQLPLLRNILLC